MGELFNKSIYTEADGPYSAWLQAHDEQEHVEKWFVERLKSFSFAEKQDRELSIIDFGCGEGNLSIRFIQVLRDLGFHVDYTAVDASQEQLDRFRHHAVEVGLKDIRYVCHDVEGLVPDRHFDLAIASHSLYYCADIQNVLRTILNCADEVILIHQGIRGVNTLYELFRLGSREVTQIQSTHQQILQSLSSSDFSPLLRDRILKQFTFTIDVSVLSCLDSASQHGRDLMSFFLHQDYGTISEETTKALRDFLQKNYAPTYTMPHDIEVLVVTSSSTI